MPLNRPKKSRKDFLALKPSDDLFPIVRFVVSVSRTHSKFYIWSVVALLIIITIMGDLITINGLILVFGILLYVLWRFLKRWLDKKEEK